MYLYIHYILMYMSGYMYIQIYMYICSIYEYM